MDRFYLCLCNILPRRFFYWAQHKIIMMIAQHMTDNDIDGIDCTSLTGMEMVQYLATGKIDSVDDDDDAEVSGDT